MKKYIKPQITMTNIKPVSLLSGSNEGPNANIVNPGINSSSSRMWDDDDDFAE